MCWEYEGSDNIYLKISYFLVKVDRKSLYPECWGWCWWWNVTRNAFASPNNDPPEKGKKIRGLINGLNIFLPIDTIHGSQGKNTGVACHSLLQIEKAGLKLSFQKTNIIASDPITFWQIEGEKVGTGTDFIFLGSKQQW